MTMPPLAALIARDAAIDIAEAKEVQVEVDRVRNVVYVHVDGVTLFRACRSEHILLTERLP